MMFLCLKMVAKSIDYRILLQRDEFSFREKPWQVFQEYSQHYTHPDDHSSPTYDMIP